LCRHAAVKLGKGGRQKPSGMGKHAYQVNVERGHFQGQGSSGGGREKVAKSREKRGWGRVSVLGLFYKRAPGTGGCLAARDHSTYYGVFGGQSALRNNGKLRSFNRCVAPLKVCVRVVFVIVFGSQEAIYLNTGPWPQISDRLFLEVRVGENQFKLYRYSWAMDKTVGDRKKHGGSLATSED